MEPSVKAAKEALRSQIAAALSRVSASDRAERSLRACALMARQPVWARSGAVLLFAPMPGELDIWPLVHRALAEGKRVALPRYLRESRAYTACWVQDPETEVRPGFYGIREPVSTCPEAVLNSLDLILVPGVAFDLHGRRLGRGKGFYDQLLAGVRGTTCGVAFDEQLVAEVPVEPHDVLLNCILSPTRWIEPHAAPVVE